MPVFFSSTGFWLSGAAQQQLGFLNFTSGSVWKWCMCDVKFRKPIIEQSVAHGTLIDAPRYASAWQQRKRHQVRSVLCERSNAHSVRKYKMAALTRCWNKNGPVASLACLIPGVIFIKHICTYPKNKPKSRFLAWYNLPTSKKQRYKLSKSYTTGTKFNTQAFKLPNNAM